MVSLFVTLDTFLIGMARRCAGHHYGYETFLVLHPSFYDEQQLNANRDWSLPEYAAEDRFHVSPDRGGIKNRPSNSEKLGKAIDPETRGR